MVTGFAMTKVQIASGVIYLCDECQGSFLFRNQTVNYDDSGWSQDRKRTWLEYVMKANRFFRKLNQWCKGETLEIVYSIDGYWHNIAYSSKTLQSLQTSVT